MASPTANPTVEHVDIACEQIGQANVEIPGRGHALTIDSGWREVADTALIFIRRFI